MSIEELLDKEAHDYQCNMKKKTLKSTAAYNNYSYGSRECASYSMDSIMGAYQEYKESLAW